MATFVRLSTKITIIATGNGDIAWMAGAEFDQGRDAGPAWPADGLVQPMTIMFRVSGIDHAESMEARGGRSNYRFPADRNIEPANVDVSQVQCVLFG